MLVDIFGAVPAVYTFPFLLGRVGRRKASPTPTPKGKRFRFLGFVADSLVHPSRPLGLLDADPFVVTLYLVAPPQVPSLKSMRFRPVGRVAQCLVAASVTVHPWRWIQCYGSLDRAFRLTVQPPRSILVLPYDFVYGVALSHRRPSSCRWNRCPSFVVGVHRRGSDLAQARDALPCTLVGMPLAAFVGSPLILGPVHCTAAGDLHLDDGPVTRQVSIPFGGVVLSHRRPPTR